MSDAPPVLLDIDGPMATITINRPDRRNAINPEVTAGISDTLTRAEQDEAIKVVVLTGAGDKAFCAGGDLGGMSGAGAVQEHFLRSELGDLFEQMRDSRLIVVAAVNGHALGGGFGLALAADLIVAAEEAQFGTPEIKLGLWPFIITAVLRRDIPRKVVMEMMLTGRRIGVDEARRWGFVNRAAPRAELDVAVKELVDEILAQSPVVVGLGKRSFYRSEDMAFEDAVSYLAGMLTLCLQTEDTVEGVTAFLQKRAPEWKGR